LRVKGGIKMPKEMPGIGLVYELQEVAEQLGASKFTVLRHYRRGNMPGRKIGRRILFTGDAIKAFLESGSPTRRGQGPQADQRPATPPPTTREQGDMIERNRIMDAMRLAGNYREAAAKKLGYSAVTLRKNIKRFGLQFPDNRGKQG
jgi:excisionase family DNA binding protein